MTIKELESKLNKKDTNIFIDWYSTGTPDMKNVLGLLYKNNYNFVCRPNLNINQPLTDLKQDMETAFFSFYHGNSRPILHVFYNNINGKNEIQYTTASVIKTYPQHKNAKIHLIWSWYEKHNHPWTYETTCKRP